MSLSIVIVNEKDSVFQKITRRARKKGRDTSGSVSSDQKISQCRFHNVPVILLY